MIRGFYTARSGLIGHQEHMNMLANNLANVNTVAFKPMRTAFKDLMYQNLNRAEAEDTAMTGHGVKVNKNDVDMRSGAFQTTDRSMDVAIEAENGFFMLETPEGTIRYSRAGNFQMSLMEDDTYLLTSASGEFVLDIDGERIELDVDELGNPIFDSERVGVFSFPNPYALMLTGSNGYVETPESGEATAIENPALKVGYLEGSGVEIAKEMANVIEASKAFALSSRMVQVADEIEQTINSLR